MRLRFVSDYPDIGDGLLYIRYPSSPSDRRDVSIVSSMKCPVRMRTVCSMPIE